MNTSVPSPKSSKTIEILFVDPYVVIANKPSGLLVHRGWDNDDDVALFRVRDAVGQHVYAVHRLDRGTSGALIFARSKEVASAFAGAFDNGQIEKGYFALVRGTPPESGTIDHPIPKSEGGPRVPALTRYCRIARSPVDRCSLVLAMPESGRLHQVRRHLRHIHHPLIGDVNYGSGEINRHYRSQYHFNRLGLHAYSISFPHPVTSDRITAVAPLPEDFATVLTALALPHQVDVTSESRASL